MYPRPSRYPKTPVFGLDATKVMLYFITNNFFAFFFFNADNVSAFFSGYPQNVVITQ